MKWIIYGSLAVVIIPAVIVLVGAALPKEHTARRKILLRAPPGEVFALIVGRAVRSGHARCVTMCTSDPRAPR